MLATLDVAVVLAGLSCELSRAVNEVLVSWKGILPKANKASRPAQESL